MARVRAVSPFFTAVLILLGIVARADAAPRRVLLLYSYEREFSHYTFASLFRPELTRTSAEPIDYIELSVQSVRANGSEREQQTVADVRGALGSQSIDLVVPIGGPAAAFAQRYRAELFPDTPVLLGAVDSRFVESGPLPLNETAVTVKNDPVCMLETMLTLLPDTRTVMVVIGASKPEQFWLDEVRRLFRSYEGRLSFIFTNRMSLAEVMRAAGRLPPHSAILYGVYSMDAAGVPQMELPTLDALHAAANAPMFGLHSHQLGHGIVGGPLLSMEDVSHDTTAIALRLLHGEAASTIGARTLVAGTPVFDARELQRWGMSEARLLPGSVVRFRQPSLWQRHAGLITAALTAACLQTLLLVGLAVTLVRNRRGRALPAAAASWDVSGAETALERLTHRLMQAHEEERARIAATLHDDVCQQLTGLKMRLQSIGLEPGPANAALRSRIEELCDQFGALERRILALTDPVYARLEMLGLVASARAYCHRLCQEHGITLAFRVEDVPPRLCGRVTLAVFRVLQAAMQNAVAHAETPRIAVSIAVRGGRLELEVDDEGKGFDPDAAIRAGAVGLIDMRERLRLVGGSCVFISRPGAGTRIIGSVAV